MPSSRVRVTRDAGLTAVRVAAPRSWTMIAFLLFWMVGWAGGEAAVWRSLTSEAIRPSAYGFVGAWFLLWTLGGIAGVLGLLWAFAGHEVASVRGDTLMVRRAAGPLGKTQAFPLAGVRDLRYLPPTTGDWTRRAAPGTIAFDHGGRTIRFGTYLGATDGRLVVETLSPLVPGAPLAR